MKKILTIIMSAALIFSLSIPAFADTSYPPVPTDTVDGEHYDYIEVVEFIRNTGSIHAVVIGKQEEDQSVIARYDERDGGLYLSVGVDYYGHYAHYEWYMLENINGSTVWSKQASNEIGPSSNRLKIPSVQSFLESTFDIYDYNDNSILVFPQPPSVDQTMTENLENLVAKPIMKTMLLLAVCGIGLIASLTVLEILRRVFSIFRV